MIYQKKKLIKQSHLQLYEKNKIPINKFNQKWKDQHTEN